MKKTIFRDNKPGQANGATIAEMLNAPMPSCHFLSVLPSNKTSPLLSSLLHDLESQNEVCPIIHFSSAYAKEGSAVVGFEAAFAAARLYEGKNVLFIDCSAVPYPITAHLRTSAKASLHSYLNNQIAQPQIPFVRVKGDGQLYYTYLTSNPKDSDATLGTQAFSDFLTQMKQTFDLVIVATEDGLSSLSTISFTVLANANVIVVEALKTRLPVLQKFKQTIEANGGKINGTILNRQRHFIPNWLYRWLF